MVTETNNEKKSPWNGTAATGVGLGGAALLLALIQSGTLGNFLGGNRPPLPTPASKDDLAYERQLTEKDSEIGQLKAEKYADVAVLAAERRLADKIAAIETSTTARFDAQNEYNVANTAAVANLSAQTQRLMSMTGLIINGPAMAASQAAASAFTGKATGAAAAANANG